MEPQLILHNGKFTTLTRNMPEAAALAIADGKISSVGSDAEILPLAGSSTQKIDLNRRRAIPGLNDSHLHVIRAGLFYNLELRWDGVPSVAQAMEQLELQAKNTPPPQWVRIVGGWNEFQFVEGRMPTLDEINKAAPDTPVFVLHLYDSALLNRAALRSPRFRQEHAESAGRRNREEPAGRPHRPPNRRTQCADPLFDDCQRTETVTGRPTELNAPLHAGVESLWGDKRLGRRRRGSKLSRRLCRRETAR